MDDLNPNCIPRMAELNPTFGCTITRASFPAMTPDKLVAMGMDQIAAAEIVANAVEAKAIGVREKGIMALLRGKTRNIKTQITMEKFGDQQVGAPFILRNQRSEFNANYWSLEDSDAAPTAGSDLPAHARRFKIKVGRPIAGFATPLTKIERYFLRGLTLTVETWAGTVSKAASVQNFEIVEAGNDDANGGGEPQAWVDVIPIEITEDAWLELDPETEQPEYSPTYGVVIIGANSISEYEDYCEQQPAEFSRKMIVDWVQDTRSAFKITDEYKKSLEKVLTGKINPYQQRYNFISIVEQRRMAEERENQAFFNSVFYGVPYAEQDVNTYRDTLPKVYDPEDPTCILGYKARAEGIFTKLAKCGRVRDLSGQPLDMDQLFSWLYQIRQHRDLDGGDNMVIDCLSSFWNKNLLFDVMTKYYTARYGVGISKWYQRGQKVQHDDWVSFEYDIYDIPDAGCQLVVYHDDYFTHRANQFSKLVSGSEDFAPRGNALWFLDFNDIHIGDGGTAQVVRTHPDPTVLALYKCRMKHNATEYILKNRRWTVMLDRPYRHLIVHNFSSECPTVAAVGCEAPNPAE